MNSGPYDVRYRANVGQWAILTNYGRGYDIVSALAEVDRLQNHGLDAQVIEECAAAELGYRTVA